MMRVYIPRGGGNCAGSDSIVRQRCSIQRGLDQHPRVGVVRAGWRSESHPAPPTSRRLGVKPAEDHPPASEGSLHDGGGSVGILTDNFTPAGKLRAILP